MKWLVALLALGGAGCSKPLQCTAEVTEGTGTHRASARAEAGESERELKRRALKLACADLCKARDGKGCEARCTVDADAGKIGARVQCGK